MVGLDTMAHVIKTMGDTLPDDPWHQYFKAPKWLDALIAKGALGQKVGAGIFRKVGKDIVVLDLEKQDYRPADRAAAPEVVEILKIKNPAEKFAKLRESQHPQAQFLWATFRDLFHYSAYHLADIAETARDVADKTWDLVHDRSDDDPVKRRVVEAHEALARLSARGGGTGF